ncbi:MAG: glutamate-cysteine ligase family protein [bacterium]|nr:glutamate-cysteine ligase family protein [bacterium]
MTDSPLHLLQGFGLELELMVVDARTLDPLPVADALLAAAAAEPDARCECQPGEAVDDVEFGDFGWSNELVLHLIEFKTAGPVASLAGVERGLQEQVARANRLLEPLGGRLLPGAMHPWLDPARHTRLWPHGNREVYAAYDRIFGCAGHGWSNLQSAHLNLAFADDAEFARLHAAVRLVLPLIPALAAASPVVEGRATGWLDTRLEVYRGNQARIPSIAGLLVPEPVWTRRAYEERILRRIWADIAPHDPDGLLRHEWLNSRGAIARFDRMALEIRLVDAQECPAADAAVAAAIGQAVAHLVQERWASLAAQQALSTEALAETLWACARDGERALVHDESLLACFGRGRPLEGGDLWRCILAERPLMDPAHSATIDRLLTAGPLARRLLAALGPDPDGARLKDVWERLADGLAAGRLFLP